MDLDALTRIVGIVDDFIWGLPLICLSGVIVAETKSYFRRLRDGVLVK